MILSSMQVHVFSDYDEPEGLGGLLHKKQNTVLHIKWIFRISRQGQTPQASSTEKNGIRRNSTEKSFAKTR